MSAYPSVVFHVRQEKKHGVASLAAIKFVKFEGLSHIVANKGKILSLRTAQFNFRKLLASATQTWNISAPLDLQLLQKMFMFLPLPAMSPSESYCV